MDLEDGRLYIRALSQYVHAHEKSLASPSLRRHTSSNDSHPHTGALIARPATAQPVTSSSSSTSTNPRATFGFFSSIAPPSKLYLTPNQLYFLLSRFEELGVTIGPMNVRLENITLDSTPSNYVSFLTNIKRPKHRNADQDSLHSVSSVRSVVSSMSSLWSNLGMGSTAEQKEEKRAIQEKEDLRYLYSSMTKIPALKFALDHRIRRIKGYEEFPFDTAVPLWAFKNLSVLEIVDLDFRSFFGWDRLAEQLRSLTLKRADIDDLADLLTNIVLDDMDRRRRRSAKSPSSPVMAFSSPSPAQRKAELARAYAGTGTQKESKDSKRQSTDGSADGSSPRPVTGNSPPTRTGSLRRGSPYLSGNKHVKQRRSSSSSSSNARNTPQTSSSNLLSFGLSPSLKWRFLKHLSLADNGLTSISAHGIYPLKDTLESLDLSMNLFAEVPDSLSVLTALRALNLSGCMIDSLNSLSRNPLPAVTVLNLRSNRLRSVAGIDKLYSLERLDLRCNCLSDPTELARLTGMPDFKEVYVVKNPFTKTHPNHRVQIFNLFRKTPGYTQDILVDHSGPRYGERKMLVERTPERVPVPIVRPPPEDVSEDETPEPAEQRTPTILPGNIMPDDSVEEPILSPSSPASKAIARAKRKSARRRIVDMSMEESPRTTPLSQRSYPSNMEGPTFVSALQSPTLTTIRTVTRQAVEEVESPSRPYDSEQDSRLTTPSSPMQPTTPGPDEMLRSNMPDLGLTSEQYRTRIEALKREYGSGWLSALHHDANSNPFFHERTATSPGAVS